MDFTPEETTYNLDQDITFSISIDPEPTGEYSYFWSINGKETWLIEEPDEITGFLINPGQGLNPTLDVTTSDTIVGEYEIKCIVGNFSGQLGEVVRTLIVESN